MKIQHIRKSLKNEYLVVQTKLTPLGGVYPRGFCVHIDDECLVLQEKLEVQGQLAGTEKFSKPFYVVPLDDIRGIAVIDPIKEQIHETEPELKKSTQQPHIDPVVPSIDAVDRFKDVDFDDQLPESYVEEYLK